MAQNGLTIRGDSIPYVTEKCTHGLTIGLICDIIQPYARR
jgi:hypothetical protein